VARPLRKWQTYRDPFGLSTLQLPPGWTAQIEPATTWYIDSSGSETVNEEMVTLANPSQGTRSARFRIVADPIKTAFDHQYVCQDPSVLQGFSPMNLATIEHRDEVWIFTTETASFQIDVTIPGVAVPDNFAPPSPATPLPASWVATDSTDLNAMLVSFRPVDPKPLVC
jgi:hypothetical protein